LQHALLADQLFIGDKMRGSCEMCYFCGADITMEFYLNQGDVACCDEGILQYVLHKALLTIINPFL